MLNSVIVAAASVALALTLGLLAALALDRADFPGKALFRRLVLLPLILPGIITGLSLLMFAVFVHLPLSLATVFLGHGTALISVATTELFAGLQKIDRAQEEASLDLGATPWQTFWRVTLPNLKLSLIAAGLLIFTLSMDEIAVTFFLIGRDNTLPLEIWGRLRRGITPEINAISTLIFAVSVALIVIWYRIRTRSLSPEHTIFSINTQHKSSNRSKPHDATRTIPAAISSNLSSQAPSPPVVPSTTRSSPLLPKATQPPLAQPLLTSMANISRSATRFATATRSISPLPAAKSKSSSSAQAPLASPPHISSAAKISFSSKKKITSAATPIRKNSKVSRLPLAPPTLSATTKAINSRAKSASSSCR